MENLTVLIVGDDYDCRQVLRLNLQRRGVRVIEASGSEEGAYHKAARGLQRAVPGEAYLWCSIKQAVR